MSCNRSVLITACSAEAAKLALRCAIDVDNAQAATHADAIRSRTGNQMLIISRPRAKVDLLTQLPHGLTLKPMYAIYCCHGSLLPLSMTSASTASLLLLELPEAKPIIE